MKNDKLFYILVLILFIQTGLVFGQIKYTRPANWATRVENRTMTNLWRLNDSIYRSEKPSKQAFISLKNLGIKSVLNLRSISSDKSNMGSLNIKEFHIKMKAHNIIDKDIVLALRFLHKSPKPILIHCRHGSDRTGVIVAMYRIVFQGWSKEQAIDELENGGYGFHSVFTNIPDYIRKTNIELLKKQIK